MSIYKFCKKKNGYIVVFVMNIFKKNFVTNLKESFVKVSKMIVIYVYTG